MERDGPLSVPAVMLASRVLFPGTTVGVLLPKPASRVLRPKLTRDLLVVAVPQFSDDEGAAESGATGRALVRTTTEEKLPSVGCLARVVKFADVDANREQQLVVQLEGLYRVRIKSSSVVDGERVLNVERVADILPSKDDMEFVEQFRALKVAAKDMLTVLGEFQPVKQIASNFNKRIDTLPPPALVDVLAAVLTTSPEKAELLGELRVKERVVRTTALLQKEALLVGLAQNVASLNTTLTQKEKRVQELRRKLREIQDELGASEDQEDDVSMLTQRLQELNLPEDADRSVQRDARRLARLNPSSAEYASLRDYLERISELPWNKLDDDTIDIDQTQRQLDADHFGLDKVKRRIIEYLAIRKLRPNMKGPILCLIGPPGVGKTSLGRSIADALGRRFARISLGGVHDESDIRGHRRTYVGAMPGRIINAISQARTSNPVMLLDEIDKVSRSMHGDPAAALLEVLDPEQNNAFTDHYINVPFDLSKVLFIATANNADDIPDALYDRMEVIRIPGYTFDEKVQIAKRYLFPKHVAACGLGADEFTIADDVLMKIAVNYTREPGVRNLERKIASVCRGFAVDKASAKTKTSETPRAITYEDVQRILGQGILDDDWAERTTVPGVATGMAWSSSGAGSILFVESTKSPGKGRLQLTGKLGDVMRESAAAAISWVKSNADTLFPWGATEAAKALDSTDLHIHFPAGAIPKDGPSAGVTIVSSLVSLLANSPLRPLTSMTGEISLRGLVLPVGGIRDKVLAAHRSGIKRVILPVANKRDLEEVPASARDAIEFVFAKTIIDVLEAALDKRATQAAPEAPQSRL